MRMGMRMRNFPHPTTHECKCKCMTDLCRVNKHVPAKIRHIISESHPDCQEDTNRKRSYRRPHSRAVSLTTYHTTHSRAASLPTYHTTNLPHSRTVSLTTYHSVRSRQRQHHLDREYGGCVSHIEDQHVVLWLLQQHQGQVLRLGDQGRDCLHQRGLRW